jgi:hypothetical protein
VGLLVSGLRGIVYFLKEFRCRNYPFGYFEKPFSAAFSTTNEVEDGARCSSSRHMHIEVKYYRYVYHFHCEKARDFQVSFFIIISRHPGRYNDVRGNRTVEYRHLIAG